MQWVEEDGVGAVWSGRTWAPPRPATLVGFGLGLLGLALLGTWCALLVELDITIDAVSLWVFSPLVAFGVAGASSTYRTTCRILNRACVRLDAETFSFAHGPLPQGGALREPTANIVRFDAARIRSAASPGWNVHLLTRDRRLVPLRFEYPEASHAVFVAARLNEVLAESRRPLVPYRQ